MCQVNGKAKNSTPHCSHISQPIFLKLKTKKNSQDTTLHAKCGWGRMTGRGSAKMANFGLLLVLSFFVLFAPRPDHIVGPITTNKGSKRVFLRKEVLLGVSMIQSKVWGSKLPKNVILGAWIGILGQIYEIFKSRYLESHSRAQILASVLSVSARYERAARKHKQTVTNDKNTINKNRNRPSTAGK